VRAKSAFFSASLGLDVALHAQKENNEAFNTALAQSKEFVKIGDADQAETSLGVSALYILFGSAQSRQKHHCELKQWFSPINRTTKFP
jgi:hypothetical protein